MNGVFIICLSGEPLIRLCPPQILPSEVRQVGLSLLMNLAVKYGQLVDFFNCPPFSSHPEALG